MEFSKAATALGSITGYVAVSHNGDSAALVRVGVSDFVGVLMPLRTDSHTVIDTAPKWAKGAI